LTRNEQAFTTVLDVLLAAVLTLGIVRALRQRSVVGAACGLAIAYGFLIALINLGSALAGRAVAGGYAFVLFFIGTPMVPVPPGGSWPLSRSIAAHPYARLIVSAALASVVFVVATRQSSRLRPESLEARRWDALASPFLLIAVLDTIVTVAATTMRWLAERPI
jgi:hypothetical protein